MSHAEPDSEALAASVVRRLKRVAGAAGAATLTQTENRLVCFLRAASFDAEPERRRRTLCSAAATVDPSVVVQMCALVGYGRLRWSDLNTWWERFANALPWVVARLSADPRASFDDIAPLVDLNDSRLTCAYLACCPEERGPNALTRAGAIIDLRLGSSTWVGKVRSSSANALAEEEARQAIIERLRLRPRGDGSVSAAIESNIEVVVPHALHVPSAQTWTLEARLEGTTVEGLLLQAMLSGHHLDAIRKLCSHLLEHGILWGDLSPRNILVTDLPDGGIAFGLVDFEKVRIANGAQRGDDAYEFLRAGMAIEEFAPLCTDDAMVRLFGSDWLDGTRLHRPRRELSHFLHHRGVSAGDPTVVDEMDRLVWQVRRPLNAASGRVLPGAINIRLQHYAACLGLAERSYVLEHLLTAGFVRCLELDLFEVAVAAATDVIAHLEDVAVDAEAVRRWRAVAGGPVPGGPPENDLVDIEAWIEALATESTRSAMMAVIERRPFADRVPHGG